MVREIDALTHSKSAPGVAELADAPDSKSAFYASPFKLPINYGNIGPSKGEVIGIIAGAAAVLGVTAYLIYRGTHKHASIQGCVTSDQNLSLRNDKDKKTYFLGGDFAAFRPGQHVALSGKKKEGLVRKTDLPNAETQ